MTTACPQPDVLRGYLHGKSTEVETETIENHIATCSACQILLEFLSEQSDSLMHEIVDAVRSRARVHVAVGDDVVSAMREDNAGLPDGSSQGHGGRERPSRIIGSYRLLECIGQGGMGSVYRALHVHLEKEVALKLLKPERRGSPEAILRFEREMRLLARLNHSNIVRAEFCGEQDGLPYFVMDFVRGINLNQLVRRVGPLPVQDACHIVCLAASALQHAHDQSVIHRDVKPSNLMLTPDGNVKLLDLGLAQILEVNGADALSRADQVLGTLDYMSPEQLSGRHQVTFQSDIYSLGVTLHELLTGLRPNGRLGLPPRASEIQSIRPDVDPSLVSLVADMLAVDPNRRPLSMSEVESRLKQIASPTKLSALLAEYYRWSSRGLPSVASGFAKADTQASAAHSTDRLSTSTASDNANPPVALPKLQTWKHASFLRNAQSLTVLGCIAVVSMMAVALWREGATDSMVQWTGTSDFASQLLQDGLVSLVNLKTGKVDELIRQNLKLPAGKYKLHYDLPIDIQAEGTLIEIAPGSTRTLRIEAQLREVFQHPVLPYVGAFATYYGVISHAGWGADAKAMAYTLSLEVLAEEDNSPDLRLYKWLLVEITDDDCQYTETAYIKVDVKSWEIAKKLEISEGWIQASGPEIERFLSERAASSSGDGLVVPFDCRHDLLSEVEGLNLPKRRLSVQDAIALFFAADDDMPIAAAPIHIARQKLVEQQRNEWLGPVKTYNGITNCYVASSRTKDQADNEVGYRIARHRSDSSYPFAIVEIQVTTPILTATCTTKVAGTAKPDKERIERKFTALKSAALKGAALKGEASKGDASKGEASKGEASKSAVLEDEALKSAATLIAPVGQNDFAQYQKDFEEYTEWFTNGAFLPPVEVIPRRRGLASEPKPVESPKTVEAPARVDPPKPVAPREPVAPRKPIERTGRFDLAMMPKVPALTIWTGSISHGSHRRESVILNARMLGTASAEGREYRWIELAISSSMEGHPDCWEAARLIVDAAAYDKDNVLSIKQGWIAYGDWENVFKIPDSGNLDEVVELRLQLQQQLQVDRVGVNDALSSLFNAELRPKTPISGLRAIINGILAGKERESVPETRSLRNTTYVGECWKFPDHPAPNSLLNYSFFRSPQVPFGFVSVNLTAGGININLEVDRVAVAEKPGFSDSIFPKSTELLEALNRNMARLPTDPNWRVWAWTDNGKTYMTWAEFGGTLKRQTGLDVLLRNGEGTEICVPERLLRIKDQDFVRKGRHWVTFSDNPQRVLVEDKANELKFQLTNGSVRTYKDSLAKVDQVWLSALRAAINRKASLTNSVKQWNAFTGYVR